MKVKFLFWPLVCLLLLSACTKDEQSREPAYYCYYTAVLLSAAGEDAIMPQPLTAEQVLGDTTEERAESLVRHLLNGPHTMEMRSPFPAHTTLRDLQVVNYTAKVDLSAEYLQLSGIDLSLADYCIALTLTQLPEIYSVRILVEGAELTYRDKPVMRSDDALLGSRENAVRTLPVSLWYRDPDNGEPRAQERLLELREGDTMAESLLELYWQQEKDSPLIHVIPEGLQYLGVRVDGGVAYLNLAPDAAAYLPQGFTLQRQMLGCITRTLCSLDTIDSVQFLVDGQLTETLGEVRIDQPILP